VTNRSFPVSLIRQIIATCRPSPAGPTISYRGPRGSRENRRRTRPWAMTCSTVVSGQPAVGGRSSRTDTHEGGGSAGSRRLGAPYTPCQALTTESRTLAVWIAALLPNTLPEVKWILADAPSTRTALVLYGEVRKAVRRFDSTAVRRYKNSSAVRLHGSTRTIRRYGGQRAEVSPSTGSG
jgi:hypothetical protein